MKKTTKTVGIYFNGIIDVLFIISIFASIKYPVANFISLAIAVIALVINVKMIKSAKKRSK